MLFNTPEQVRADQLAVARQMESIGEPKPYGRSTLRVPAARKAVSKVAPKGHEAFLKALEFSGAIVTFEKSSSGEKVIGKIKCSDKYTVSVMVNQDGEAQTRVLFKHDISEFSTTAVARPVEAL